MTDDDLERDLRAMLTVRAADIRSVPDAVLTLDAPLPTDDHGGDGEVLELSAFRSELLASVRRCWPLLVVAAAVLAVLGGVLAVLVAPSTHDRTPPSHELKLSMITRAACTATLPTSWQETVEKSSVGLPDTGSDPVVAVTDDGGAVIANFVASTRERVGYVAPGATSVHWLGTFGINSSGRYDYGFNLDFDVTGRTVLISVESGRQKLGKHVVVHQTLHEIVAVDLDDGRQTVLSRIPYSRGSIERKAFALNGVAYWQAEMPSAKRAGRSVEQILSRPVGGGPVTTLASGGYYDLQESALGISWTLDQDVLDRPVGVPPVVQRTVTAQVIGGNSALSYVTDGHVWAWQTEQGALNWYDPSSGRLVRIPKLLGPPDSGPGQAFVYSVAGPLVYYQDETGNADRLIDVRTGAVLPASPGGFLFGSHGTLIGSSDALGADVTASGSNLMRLHTADLPPARC